MSDAPDRPRPAHDAGRAPRFMRKRDAVFVLGFVAFWLLPMLSEGVFRRPLHGWLPERFHDQYRIVCLFSTSHRVKLEFYVQASFGDGEWFDLPDEEYTPMQPFGYVNRNWAMMYGINAAAIRETRLRLDPDAPDAQALRDERPLSEARMRAGAELAAWYRARFRAKHPDRPDLASVRFVAVWHPVGSEIAAPPGHWRRRPVDELPPDRVHVILQRDFRRG